MKLAKIIVLSNGVEVIVKKVIVNSRFGCTLSFMAEMEDKSLTTTVLPLSTIKKRLEMKILQL